MFYSQFILAKKGPLGTIWIAAHLERKLRKNQVADTDIGVSVDSILFPEVPIALRLSSHLLLGVVRIYSRKVNYLFDDCSEALLKIKQAFRSTAVDLPPEESTAPYHSITLPETFDLDDFELPENDIFQGNYVDHHVSSREQITLQDTMEGVVYSTSQFGLDERFGDGETSGLDLDEELLLDKVAASGHAGVMLSPDADPQASVQSMTPLKQDENHEGMTANSETRLATGSIEGVDGDTDFIEDAQAPCTPGLVEEPNLSNVQETSACDDHLESEDPHLTEFAVRENLENASSKSDLHHENKNVVDWSLLNDMNTDTVHPAEENGHLLGDQDIKQLKPHEESPPTAMTMEHISSDNPDSESLPSSVLADQVRAISPVSAMSYRDITASNVPEGVEDLQNRIVGNNEPGIHTMDGSHEDCVEPRGVRLNESTLDMSSLTSTCQAVSEGVSENNQESLMAEVSNNVEIAGNLEKSCFLNNALESNCESHDRTILESPETQACWEPKDSKILNPAVHEEMACTHIQVLQPCNTHLNEPSTSNPGGDNSVAPDLPSEVGLCSPENFVREEAPHASGASTVVQGEGCHATDGLEPVLEESHITEPASCEDIQAGCSKSNDQVDNVISGDSQLENLNISAGPDLPAPEKLLSIPDGLADLPNNLLVESTPDKGVLEGDDADGAGSKIISGKKRSFTESTLTVQSLNSVESLGLFHTKRTAESIPDDDDLLSSILVGRSSVMKVKSTPTPAPEITSMKRPRSAPRTSASKRKVLMDDTMVLHGDTIRQQLTNTEDIRRVRKKAPCTRPEILMIQKQFLEDEIFSEPIFTGVSMELVSLHNQTYDLSETRVSQNDVNNASSGAATDLKLISQNDETSTYLEAANDMDFSIGLNVVKETGMEGCSEPMTVRDDGEALPIETPVLTENQQGEAHAVSSEVYATQKQMEFISNVAEPKSSQHELLGKMAEMEIDGTSVSVADAVNPAVTVGVESSYPTDLVSGDICGISAGMIQSASLDRTSEADNSLQMDAPGGSPDQKLDMQSVEIEASMVAISSGKGVDANEAAVEKDEDIAAVETESRAGEEFLLGEAEVGVSVEIGTDIHTDCSAHTKIANTSPAIFSPETVGCSTQVVTIEHAMEDIGKNELGVLPEDEVLDSEVEYNAKKLNSNGISGEESKIDSSYSEVNVDLKNVSLDDGENPNQQEAYPLSMNNVEISAINHIAVDDRDDFDYSAVGHDTEFLNVDDDEVAEVDNDYMPSADETHFLENSGWSSRTRAVAKYLQTLFDKEAERGRKVLPMDNLLAGKTRKEASRMFFEALVLKTKDYIHVEQEDPFHNINIKPRVMLMKSNF